ncbi:MAG TPA: protein-L-isoaspartate(D-aspartate) O-methyltransferase [Tepidisphaeraceae bacterium]|nr:protein-L-isoaspartate(D-aspartate) O-methyltransferase [Tepidisphaeraceae bacterium]
MKQLTEASPLERMIQQQVIERGIRDERLIAALRAVPREKFFRDDARHEAFAGRAAPIGHGQTISEPYIVALMTHRLQVKPEHKILELGTGSGYQTAVLAKLAGHVYSIERVKALLDQAFERLMELGIRNVHLRYGDGTLGWHEEAPFDRILIAAGAPDVPRELLLGQLKNGGIAILPAGTEREQTLLEVQRHGDELKTEEICPCVFVKLIGKEGWAPKSE